MDYYELLWATDLFLDEDNVSKAGSAKPVPFKWKVLSTQK